jgi:GNAT superfamily N-acetyltransferase
MRKHIHVWHLEITERHTIPGEELPRRYSLQRLDARMPELLRFLYITVGAPWWWYMRLGWKYRDWLDRMEDGRVEFWVAYADGAPAGYFELEAQPNHSVEICYFGLVPEFIGQGHGKALLADAIEKAWHLGAKRVWLHTCSLDHPNALPNYLKRGFAVFKEEDVVDNVPDDPIQPWAGAGKP